MHCTRTISIKYSRHLSCNDGKVVEILLIWDSHPRLERLANMSGFIFMEAPPTIAQSDSIERRLWQAK